MGTSRKLYCGVILRKDHPHACGDKFQLSAMTAIGKGSSPRVWGQVAVFICPVSFSGIIPTRVGTSSHNGSIGRSSKDHPHACGDKPILTEKNTRLAGSSPRVWGQANWSDQRLREIRIIPTRVGTRLTASATTSADKDHPHACGDKIVDINAEVFQLGSSPRVWGQGYGLREGSHLQRIIPTRVGTSIFLLHEKYTN